jgi:hypothetical protein
VSYLGLWWVLAGLLLFGAVIRFTMLRRLKEVSPGTWRELGEPNAFNGNLHRHMLEAAYLVRARYLALRDGKLTSLCVVYSACYLGTWSLFMFLITQQWIGRE